jgi:hypothetical protein
MMSLKDLWDTKEEPQYVTLRQSVRKKYKGRWEKTLSVGRRERMKRGSGIKDRVESSERSRGIDWSSWQHEENVTDQTPQVVL